MRGTHKINLNINIKIKMFDEIISKIKTGEMSVSTDTRTIKSGDIFFAIKGDQFDGHNFVAQALEKGAAICVVNNDFKLFQPFEPSELSELNGEQLLKVEDTIKALQQLATEYRDTLKIPIIAITGCNGKTTTKNFLASVLMQKYGTNEYGIEKVAYTKGNLNNFIGLPLAVLAIKPTHEIAVLELGSNHPGEIELLCDISKPSFGITTSIGAAHIEFFGTLEAIADEEGSVALALPKDGLYVVPKADQYAEYLLERTKARKAAVDINHIECLGAEFLNFQSKLNQIGIQAPHIIADALLVATIAHEFGVTAEQIVKGLAETKNDKGRFSISRVEIVHGATDTKTSATIIDDTYNGNPDSVIAAIKAMKELFPNERKIMVLGCLKELGDYLHTGYERIVNTSNEYGVSELILINIADSFENGSEPAEDNAQTSLIYVKDNAECIEYLKNNANNNDVILCKGSHGAKTWEVIEGLA
ncbi:MAG: UDP-N-acetylmuramoyl-tripeptide--D-alanyl-D-alanine ligase [Candidatus Pacebacteria bacterium]|nr:UDP-N-acetylmuramoyl-tripeptide--D-alanyl-D-alanine ligase [Candidatus Paceibacterota bacterium]